MGDDAVGVLAFVSAVGVLLPGQPHVVGDEHGPVVGGGQDTEVPAHAQGGEDAFPVAGGGLGGGGFFFGVGVGGGGVVVGSGRGARLSLVGVRGGKVVLLGFGSVA